MLGWTPVTWFFLIFESCHCPTQHCSASHFCAWLQQASPEKQYIWKLERGDIHSSHLCQEIICLTRRSYHINSLFPWVLQWSGIFKVVHWLLRTGCWQVYVGSVREGPTCERFIWHRRVYQIHNFFFVVKRVYYQVHLFFNHHELIAVGFFFSKLSWDKAARFYFQLMLNTRATISYLLGNFVPHREYPCRTKVPPDPSGTTWYLEHR